MTLAIKIAGAIWAPSRKLTPSLSLFICFPLGRLCPASPHQITSHRWLIRSASSSGNTDRSWRRWGGSGSGRRRRLTTWRSAGSDDAPGNRRSRSGAGVSRRWGGESWLSFETPHEVMKVQQRWSTVAERGGDNSRKTLLFGKVGF